MTTDERALLVEAYNRLKELNTSFNMTRLLMNEPGLRKEAGAMVEENRAFLKRLETAIVFKQPDKASEGQS